MDNIKPKQIIRTKRRSIALIISPDATLTVRAPFKVPSSFIEEFIQQKASWISRKIQEVLGRPQAMAKRFVDGEHFLYLGHTYELQIACVSDIVVYDKLFFPVTYLDQASDKMKNWYVDRAYELITARVNAKAKKLGLSYKNVRITNAEHRWGSCSYNGNLNFSWRLIMAPIEVIDCVVVHELVHLVEHNHSSQFWARVIAEIPDYKEAHKWLRDNNHLLKI